MKKNKSFLEVFTEDFWNGQNMAAFEEIKSRLKTAPVLAPPDYSKPWEVWTDENGCGIGSALI